MRGTVVEMVFLVCYNYNIGGFKYSVYQILIYIVLIFVTAYKNI